MLISRGLAGPKSRRNSTETTGKQVNIPVPPYSETNALGTVKPGFRPVESGNFVEAVMARSERSQTQRKLTLPRAREKGVWCPYRDPTQVLWRRKPRPVGSNRR